MKPLFGSTGPETVTELIPSPGHPDSHAVPAADAVALSLVFLLVFCVVCFAWGAAILGRREKHVAEDNPGASEGADPSTQQADRGSSRPNRAPWEREGDWWKKE